jgi:hypothetical protein
MNVVNQNVIDNIIMIIRKKKIILDRDLADLYGVETKYLNRQVRRNVKRFPKEFMFQLNKKEKNELVTNLHRFDTLKHSTVLPYAFTEQGVAMLSSVLNSEKAIQVNIQIMKTFISVRELYTTNQELKEKIDAIVQIHGTKINEHDDQINSILLTIQRLLDAEDSVKKIGFVRE